MQGQGLIGHRMLIQVRRFKRLIRGVEFHYGDTGDFIGLSFFSCQDLVRASTAVGGEKILGVSGERLGTIKFF